MKKFILLILAIIIAGGGYYYFFVSNNTEVATTSYEYIKIEKGNIKKTVSATGKIIPTSTLTLSSEISGKIVEINKDFNEQINKGEVLAIFDQNPFTLSVKESQTSVDISKSKLKQKQASLEKAKSELNNSVANKYGAESRLDDSNLYLSKLEENLDFLLVYLNTNLNHLIVIQHRIYLQLSCLILILPFQDLLVFVLI